LIINDPKYVEHAEIIREKGTNRSRFFRGEADKYTWVYIGSSYLPSDFLAAFLFAQLPFIPAHCEQTYHIFYMIFPDFNSRPNLIEHLKSRRTLSVFLYVPLPLSPMGKKFGYKESDLPNTESISDRLLRLPFYNEMTYDS